MTHRVRIGIGGLACVVVGMLGAALPVHAFAVLLVGGVIGLALSWTLIAGGPSMARAIERIERERDA